MLPIKQNYCEGKLLLTITDYLEHEELSIVYFEICNPYPSMLSVLPGTDSMKPLEGVRILDLTRFVLDYLQFTD